MENLITTSTGKTTANLDLTLLIRGRIRESIEDSLFEELVYLTDCGCLAPLCF